MWSCVCSMCGSLPLMAVLLHSAGLAQEYNELPTPESEVYTVTTILVEPYIMDLSPDGRISGNERYQGYLVDLMDKIAKTVGFQYQIVPVKDGRYGHKSPDGVWDGMVGEIITESADLAVAPLYITRHRSEVVDFTRPYLHVQATILLRRPRGNNDLPIQTATDLLDQSALKYGTLNTGVIIRAFRRSNDSFLQTLWKKMRGFTPPAFTTTNAQGISRVRDGGYSFILPSTIGEYISRRQPCDLITVDRFLMNRGYGLAVKKGSALLPKLNKVIALMEMNGDLHRLYQKWWTDRSECNGIKTSKHTHSIASIASGNISAIWTFCPSCIIVMSMSALAVYLQISVS